MLEENNQISKPQKMLLTLPIEVDRKYRQEAKKREVSISEMLTKLMDERDYFEKKLLEKEKLLENTTEIISKDIIHSLSEIKSTNLILKTISGSLTSIPMVTEEARKINERCTKSAEVIHNFNVVMNKLNEKIVDTRSSVEKYKEKINTNFSAIDKMNQDLLSLKSHLNSFVKGIENNFSELKTKLVNETKLKLDDFLIREKERVLDFKRLFDNKIKIAFGIVFALTSIMSFLFMYGYFTDVTKTRNDLSYYKNMYAWSHDLLCKYRPKTTDINYNDYCSR